MSEPDPQPEPTPVTLGSPTPRSASAATGSARPIALVGLPGSGKTTVAQLLADRLGWRWIDLDERIELVAGATIPDLFRRGESEFRRLETEVLRGVLAHPTDAVVATGGGVVVAEANRVALRRGATVLWLDVPPDLLLERLVEDPTPRPLLAGDDGVALGALAGERRGLYETVADERVEATGPPEDVVEAILALPAVRTER